MDEPKRRRRDPHATREAILEAARMLLSRHGPEGISLSEVAKLARVNRGTAYQHFATRENLIKATADWVSDKLFRAVFGDPATIGKRRVEEVDPAALTDRLAEYAMDNPELCRIWLLQILSSSDPMSDPFWCEYQGSMSRFAVTDFSQDNVDSEVLSVIMLSSAFLWPIWARSHARDDADRRQLAYRFSQECLRLCMYGSLRSERFPDVAHRVGDPADGPVKVHAATRRK